MKTIYPSLYFYSNQDSISDLRVYFLLYLVLINRLPPITPGNFWQLCSKWEDFRNTDGQLWKWGIKNEQSIHEKFYYTSQSFLSISYKLASLMVTNLFMIYVCNTVAYDINNFCTAVLNSSHVKYTGNSNY